jgi:hypothetical protein
MVVRRFRHLMTKLINAAITTKLAADPAPLSYNKYLEFLCGGPIKLPKEFIMAKNREKAKLAKRQWQASRRCGLCGKPSNLTKTECCGQWICDDEDQYVMFSYARNSCHRNHHRYTLCGHHFSEGHSGTWQDCVKCREDIETEMYVYYGTNEYNFEKLVNVPTFEPTRCSKCKKVIRLAEGGYSIKGKEYSCQSCASLAFRT